MNGPSAEGRAFPPAVQGTFVRDLGRERDRGSGQFAHKYDDGYPKINYGARADDQGTTIPTRRLYDTLRAVNANCDVTHDQLPVGDLTSICSIQTTRNSYSVPRPEMTKVLPPDAGARRLSTTPDTPTLDRARAESKMK